MAEAAPGSPDREALGLAQVQDASLAPAIEARGLSKRFGNTTVVDAIDFTVPAGGCFGILGPNGAGKTTTLRMLLGHVRPSAGELAVLGLEVPRQRREVRRRLGVVPQLDNLDPDFTVEENLLVYASFFGIPRRAAATRIEEILALVMLGERAKAPINSLSGGMKRRLSIARALVNDPDLLVLDEPTTGLDPQVRHLIWSRLRELVRRGKTLLLTTHYMEEAERLCDELIVMDAGTIVVRGKPSTLVRENVERDVLEVHAPTDSVLEALARLSQVRTEIVDETAYAYTDDAGSVIAALDALGEVPYFRRPANLEDVFLKLTGRDLRD